MNEAKVLYKTWSVCPVCLKRVPAERVQVGSGVFLWKSCPEHGSFTTLIWRGLTDINEWTGNSEVPAAEDPKCPDQCGLCGDHLQETCCVLLNVTNRCNLNCRFCFADNEATTIDPSFEEIVQSLNNLIEKGKTLVQMSGGEPTMRDDLPEIIAAAKEAGARYVQLNSNGVRLSEDRDYVKKLAEAGLSFLFMQFDGTHDEIYRSLRGKPLLDIKKRAIDNCAEFNIGVTLVPTLVRGINTDQIGEILRFAIAGSPKIRGVHFQPVTYIGRVPENPTEKDRFTLDDLLAEIQAQSDGLIKSENLLPSSCDHPLCGFHGDFIIGQHEVIPLLKRSKPVKNCCCTPTPADKNREFVARRWQRPAADQTNENACCGDVHDMEYFLDRVKSHGFTISAMAFQDAGNIDFSRLRRCSLHVYDKGKMVPFCAYYLSAWKQ
ncbi:MAG: radical SAM protein [Bacteroidales bacterium]|nr:radical SAM protein [Bacteroidales bacterium]